MLHARTRPPAPLAAAGTIPPEHVRTRAHDGTNEPTGSSEWTPRQAMHVRTQEAALHRRTGAMRAHARTRRTAVPIRACGLLCTSEPKRPFCRIEPERPSRPGEPGLSRPTHARTNPTTRHHSCRRRPPSVRQPTKRHQFCDGALDSAPQYRLIVLIPRACDRSRKRADAARRQGSAGGCRRRR